jgi:predicted amidohydrolase
MVCIGGVIPLDLGFLYNTDALFSARTTLLLESDKIVLWPFDPLLTLVDIRSYYVFIVSRKMLMLQLGELLAFSGHILDDQ